MGKVFKKKHKKHNPYEDILEEEVRILERKNIDHEFIEEELEEQDEGFNEDIFKKEMEEMEKSTQFYELSYIEMLKERKFNLKERGLHSLIRVLQQSKMMLSNEDCFKNHHDDFIEILNGFLKKPDNFNEAKLTLKLICLLGLFYAPDNETFISSFMDCLEEMIMSKEEIKDALCRETIFCYSFICFLSASYDCTIRGLDFLEGHLHRHFQTKDELRGELMGQLLHGWICLSSRLEPNEVLERCQNLDLFQCLMDSLIRSRHDFSRSSEASICMGKCMAYLWECVEEKRRMLKFESSHVHTFSFHTIAQEVEAYEEMTHEDLREFCEELAMNPRDAFMSLHDLKEAIFCQTKKLSKIEKKTEKEEFRDIFQFIFMRMRDSERISLHGMDIYIDSFILEMKIEMLREVLENGFQSCLQVFPVCMDILEINFVDFEIKDDERRRKRIISKSSHEGRRRTLARQRERRNSFGKFDSSNLIFSRA